MCWTDIPEATTRPNQDLQKNLATMAALITTNASLPALTGTARGLIGMRPDIAANWQPGSIVAYSAWGLLAHAHSGRPNPHRMPLMLTPLTFKIRHITTILVSSAAAENRIVMKHVAMPSKYQTFNAASLAAFGLGFPCTLMCNYFILIMGFAWNW